MLLQLLHNHMLQLYILIPRFCLCYVLHKKQLAHKRVLIKNKEYITQVIFQLLEHYRLKNIYPSILKLVLYMLITFVPLSLLCCSRLNTTVIILYVNSSTMLHTKIIVFILCFSFCVFYYIKVLQELIFLEISRLYLYYYNREHKFSAFVRERFINRFFIETMLTDWTLSVNEKIIVYNLEDLTRVHNLLLQYFLVRIKTLIVFIRCKRKNYFNTLLFQMPSILFILIVFYDITLSQIHYTYYALALYSLTSLISNFKRFSPNISLDEYDLQEYFYHGLYVKTVSTKEYKILNKKVEQGYKMTEEDLTFMTVRAKQIEYVSLKPEGIDFITSELKNKHVREYGDILRYKIYDFSLRHLPNAAFVTEALEHFHYAIVHNKPAVIKGISGIWEVSPFFIQNDDLIVELLLKVVINLFGGNVVSCSEDLITRVGHTLCPVSFLDRPYYYPAVQHILNSILTRNKVDVNHVTQINNHVLDYSAYMQKPVNIQLVIESFVIKYALTDYINLTKGGPKFIMQNPDDPSGDLTNFVEIAYAQMKQPNPDMREVWERIKFWDSKLIADPINKLALTRGYLSLTTSLNDYKKMHSIKRAIGDYKGVNKQKYGNDKTHEAQFNINDAAIKALPYILTQKTTTIADKFTQFTFKQHEINRHPKVSLVCSYIVKPLDDTFYENFYKTYLEGKFNKALILKEVQLHKHMLFPPKGQYVAKVQWDKSIKVIISALPEDIRATLEANYAKITFLER